MRAQFWGAGWVLAAGRGMAEEGTHGEDSFCRCERLPAGRGWRIKWQVWWLRFSFDYTRYAQNMV